MILYRIKVSICVSGSIAVGFCYVMVLTDRGQYGTSGVRGSAIVSFVAVYQLMLRYCLFVLTLVNAIFAKNSPLQQLCTVFKNDHFIHLGVLSILLAWFCSNIYI